MAAIMLLQREEVLSVIVDVEIMLHRYIHITLNKANWIVQNTLVVFSEYSIAVCGVQTRTIAVHVVQFCSALSSSFLLCLLKNRK